jgi:hypothetical protein
MLVDWMIQRRSDKAFSKGYTSKFKKRFSGTSSRLPMEANSPTSRGGKLKAPAIAMPVDNISKLGTFNFKKTNLFDSTGINFGSKNNLKLKKDLVRKKSMPLRFRSINFQNSIGLGLNDSILKFGMDRCQKDDHEALKIRPFRMMTEAQKIPDVDPLLFDNILQFDDKKTVERAGTSVPKGTKSFEDVRAEQRAVIKNRDDLMLSDMPATVTPGGFSMSAYPNTIPEEDSSHIFTGSQKTSDWQMLKDVADYINMFSDNQSKKAPNNNLLLPPSSGKKVDNTTKVLKDVSDFLAQMATTYVKSESKVVGPISTDHRKSLIIKDVAEYVSIMSGVGLGGINDNSSQGRSIGSWSQALSSVNLNENGDNKVLKDLAEFLNVVASSP